MKYYLTILSEFLKEIGRQNDLMFSGNVAPFEKPHWIKTRKGFTTAFIFAKLVADIEFSKPPFDV